MAWDAAKTGDLKLLAEAKNKGATITTYGCALLALEAGQEEFALKVDKVLGTIDKNYENGKPLETLVWNNDYKAVRVLTKLGLNLKSQRGASLFHHAKTKQMMRALANAGANVGDLHIFEIWPIFASQNYFLLEFLEESGYDFSTAVLRTHAREKYERWKRLMARTRDRAATKINFAVLSFLGRREHVRKD